MNVKLNRSIHMFQAKPKQMNAIVFLLPHLPGYMPVVMRLIFHDIAAVLPISPAP